MRVYKVALENVSVSSAITLVQVKAGSGTSLVLLRAWCKQLNQTTSAMQEVEVVRKTAAATVTSATPEKFDPDGAVAQAAGGTSATGTNASAEGTDGGILRRDSFNVLNGWEWIPVPEERPEVGGGGMIALKFPSAPGSAMTVDAGIIFGEIG